MICAVLTDLSPETVSAAQEADIVELRLDLLGVDQLDTLAGNPDFHNGIFTLRSTAQGGTCQLPQSERIKHLERACRLGVGYVDVEWDSYSEFKKPKNSDTKVIVSYHNFSGLPEHLDRLVKDMENSSADIVKIAVAVEHICETRKIFECLNLRRKPIIAIGMGDAGEITRILGLSRGSYLTYCAITEAQATAPGQVTLRHFRQHYSQLTADTEIYGVMGNPVAHSMSPAMMNAAVQASKINAAYVRFLVHDDPAGFVREFSDQVKGFSVTIPHKQAVMGALDRIDPLAEKIGAVNTIYRDGKFICGSNTDALGVISALKSSGLEIDNTVRAVVLGAGGAARATVAALVNGGAQVTVLNRTAARASALAKEMGCASAALDAINQFEYDLLINCTSVGMWPDTDACPVAVDSIIEGSYVFDQVYVPSETQLLAAARARGCKIIPGVEMFVAQGEAQFHTWFNKKPKPGLMRSVVLELLEQKKAQQS